MPKENEKMKLPLKIKLFLKDGQTLVFEGGKCSVTPFAVSITEMDKPEITRFFPWGNIRELEIPFSLEQKKVVQAGPGIGLMKQG